MGDNEPEAEAILESLSPIRASMFFDSERLQPDYDILWVACLLNKQPALRAAGGIVNRTILEKESRALRIEIPSSLFDYQKSEDVKLRDLLIRLCAKMKDL